MPRRTNAFQQVIYLIKDQISASSDVIESCMLKDRRTGTNREVDVVIKSQVGGHEVLVSIECRDHARVQSVGWVNEMNDKHSSLPTNLLVLASSSGFTAEAERVAADRNIELLGTESGSEAAERVQERLSALQWWRLHLEGRGVTVGMAAAPESEAELVRVAEDHRLFLADGTFLGTFGEIVGIVLQQSMTSDLISRANPEVRTFEVVVDPVEFTRNEGAELEQMYMEKLEPRSHLKRVEKIVVHGAASFTAGDIPLTHGHLAGITFSYGTVEDESLGTGLLLRSVDETGEERVSIRRPSGEITHLQSEF